MSRKKPKPKTLGELSQEVDALGFRPNFFSRNPELAEKLMELQHRALKLFRHERVLQRDFGEMNLADQDVWDELVERRQELVMQQQELEEALAEFKSKVGF